MLASTDQERLLIGCSLLLWLFLCALKMVAFPTELHLLHTPLLLSIGKGTNVTKKQSIRFQQSYQYYFWHLEMDSGFYKSTTVQRTL